MSCGIRFKQSCPCVMLRAVNLLIMLLVNSLDARDMTFDRLTKIGSGLYTGPYLDGGPGPINITTQLGTHAYLPCRVKQLGNNKSVSWIRRRDAHILTVDRYTFIADDRFQSFLIETTGTWTLQVKYVQSRDAGSYECQISGSESDRKLSSIVNLHVVVPHTEILGESDVYVRVGSTVALRCVVRDALLAPPTYITWYHSGHRLLQSYADRHTPWVASMERMQDDTTIGILRIESAQRQHSGNYTCHPSNLAPARVTLHVLDGEHPAAMQRDKNSAMLLRNMNYVIIIITIALVIAMH